MKCEFCGKDIVIKKTGSHGSMKSHMAACKKFIEYRNNVLNKEYLYNEYVIKRHSAKHIGDQFGFGATAVIKQLKKFGINVRGIKEACLNPERRQKYEQTCLNHFGFRHNFCKESPSRKKWEQELLDNEGIINVFQRQDVKNKIQLSLYTRPVSQINFRSITKPEKKVLDYMKEQGYNVESNKKIFVNGHTKYGDCVVDKKIVEVQGDFWHANPIKYKINDIINYNGCEIKVDYLWENDYNRYKDITSQGYKILYVWEHDINTNFDLVKEKIKKFMENGDGSGFYIKEFEKN